MYVLGWHKNKTPNPLIPITHNSTQAQSYIYTCWDEQKQNIIYRICIVDIKHIGTLRMYKVGEVTIHIFTI